MEDITFFVNSYAKNFLLPAGACKAELLRGERSVGEGRRSTLRSGRC